MQACSSLLQTVRSDGLFCVVGDMLLPPAVLISQRPSTCWDGGLRGPGPSGKISTRLAGGPGGLRGGAGGQRAEVVWRRAARPGKRPAVEDTGLAVQSQTAGLGRPPHWA